VPNDPAALDALLAGDPAITQVAVVHCETTTGLLNDIAALGAVTKKHGRTYIVDAMSSFGSIPIDFEACAIDFLISSANKCVEGVPGFSFILCRRAKLLASAGWARNLSMNLLEQLKGFEKNGQFRYTPPTHSLLAFEQALNELDLEGGVAARGARYRRNHEVLLAGMTKLGFKSYLPSAVQSHIITSFIFPADPKFTFEAFYRLVANKGYILYPGKISQADTFRIGSIGRLFEADMRAVVYAIGEAIEEMDVKL
jgi:2-aminoethylphosphonate-pyruvate transaminase